MATGKTILKIKRDVKKDRLFLETEKDMALVELILAFQMVRDRLIINMIDNGMFENANIDTNDMLAMEQFVEKMIKFMFDLNSTAQEEEKLLN